MEQALQSSNSLLEKYSYWFSVILMTLFMGLFFQVAWQYPVVDSFPLIERLINPIFLNNDFYTNTFEAFSPRLILASCIAYISQTLDVHYTLVVAYGNILRIWIYAIGLYWFFRQLANHQVALIAFSLSALSFLSVPFLPAWWPVTFDFTASNVALTFSIFAWVMILKQRVASALLLMTGAVLFHPLVGVHGSILCVLLFVSYHGWAPFWQLFREVRVYVASCIFLSVFLALYLSFDKVLDDHRFAEINGLYRHAHHFVLSHMDLEKWISTILMISISIALIFKLDIDARIKRLAITLMVYAGLMTLCAYLFVEVWPTRFMVSFIPMRAFPMLVPIIVILWSMMAWKLFSKGYLLAFFSTILPFLPYKKVGLTWFVFPNHHDLMLPILTIPLSLVLIFISTRNIRVIQFVDNTLVSLSKKWMPNPQPSLFILPIACLAMVLAVFKFNLNIPTAQTEPSIYQWLTENTSEDDLILSELNGADNQKMRLVANRAVVVSKDFPFNEHYYEEWYKRYSSVYLERDLSRGHVDTLDAKYLNTVMDQYQASILIRTELLEDNPYFALLGEAQGEKATAYIYRNTHWESP